MPDLITDITSGSSNTGIKGIGSTTAMEFDMVLVAGVMRLWTISQPATLTESERVFEEQKRLFQNIPRQSLEQYQGRFVAAINGEIRDSDDDFVTLTQRFFATVGNVPAYITKIGEDEGVFVETPFSN